MGQVAVGLGLQPNSAELGRNIVLGAGHGQRRSSDFTHLGGNKKRQNALRREEEQGISAWLEIKACARDSQQSGEAMLPDG